MTEPIASALVAALKPLIRDIARDELRTLRSESSPRYLTTEQAAARIGIGASAIRERIRKGVLPAHRWEGRLYVESDAIDEAIANSARATTVSSYPTNGPRAVAPAEGPATRS
jgi:excisionase family DNA binding protein